MSDDLIRRSDAIAEIRKARTPDVASHQYAELFINAVCRAPSADRPQGEWIEQEDCWQCSECGDEYVLEVDVKPIDAKMYYCPNCGSKMRGKHDD